MLDQKKTIKAMKAARTDFKVAFQHQQKIMGPRSKAHLTPLQLISIASSAEISNSMPGSVHGDRSSPSLNNSEH